MRHLNCRRQRTCCFRKNFSFSFHWVHYQVSIPCKSFPCDLSVILTGDGFPFMECSTLLPKLHMREIPKVYKCFNFIVFCLRGRRSNLASFSFQPVAYVVCPHVWWLRRDIAKDECILRYPEWKLGVFFVFCLLSRTASFHGTLLAFMPGWMECEWFYRSIGSRAKQAFWNYGTGFPLCFFREYSFGVLSLKRQLN